MAPDHSHRELYKVAVPLVFGLGCGVLASVIVVTSYFLEPAPYDPLGEFSEQIVLHSDTDGDGIPNAPADGPIHIEATKCNDADVDVRVAGEHSWRIIRDNGRVSTVFAGAGIGTFPPGCQTNVFDNVVPEAVRALDLDLSSTTFQIVGSNTPFDCDAIEHPECVGPEGERRVWHTELFQLGR